jgi:hypothetical protein
MSIAFWLPARQIVTFKDTDDGTTTDFDCDRCDATEACPLLLSDSGTKTALGEYKAFEKIISNLCNNASYNIHLTRDSIGGIGNRFIVTANISNVLYDTGCVLGSATDTITIPAGTSILTVTVFGACNTPGADEWALTITC